MAVEIKISITINESRVWLNPAVHSPVFDLASRPPTILVQGTSVVSPGLAARLPSPNIYSSI